MGCGASRQRTGTIEKTVSMCSDDGGRKHQRGLEEWVDSMQDDVMRDLLRACEGVLGSDGNFEKQLTALSTTEVDNVVENFGRALRYILARAAKRSDLEPLFQARDRREDMALAGLSKVEESPESAPVSSVAPSVGLSFIKEWKAAAGGESFRAGPVEGSVKMLVSPVRQAIAPPGAHRDDPVCNVLVSTKAAVRPPEEGAESPGTKFRSIQHFLQAGAPSNSSKYGTSSFMAKSFRRTASDGKTPVADAFQTVKMALTSLSNSSALDEWSIQKFFESTSSAYSMEAAKLPDLPDVLPEPTSYERATCLFFDICEFTMTCARKSSTEVRCLPRVCILSAMPGADLVRVLAGRAVAAQDPRRCRAPHAQKQGPGR
eukprot:2062240-Rhodomonas_salina.2